MSGTGTKGNFFNTLLGTITNSATAPNSLSPRPATPLASGQVASDGMNKALDNLLRREGGAATFSELLPLTDFSVDDLMVVLNHLQSLGFVSKVGQTVALTDAGRAVAATRHQLGI